MAAQNTGLIGLAETKRALAELKKATQRDVQFRALLKAAQPMVATAKALAPARPRGGKLRASITVSKIAPRGYKKPAARAFAFTRAMGGTVSQARAAAAAAGSAPSIVFIGPGRLGRAWWNEFGTSKMPPHPYLRPAFDLHRREMVQTLARELDKEVKAAAARVARKRMKNGR